MVLTSAECTPIQQKQEACYQNTPESVPFYLSEADAILLRE